eukprot:757725-Hanusia_phi.AAC.1
MSEFVIAQIRPPSPPPKDQKRPLGIQLPKGKPAGWGRARGRGEGERDDRAMQARTRLSDSLVETTLQESCPVCFSQVRLQLLLLPSHAQL